MVMIDTDFAFDRKNTNKMNEDAEEETKHFEVVTWHGPLYSSFRQQCFDIDELHADHIIVWFRQDVWLQILDTELFWSHLD